MPRHSTGVCGKNDRTRMVPNRLQRRDEGVKVTDQKTIIPIGQIEQRILLIRGQKVILDTDLAGLYGTTTKRLNEQVKRNRGRSPEDFMFQLTKKEKAEVVAICDHLAKLKFSPVLPNAFTEHGAIMAANVLNTGRAIQISVFVVRAFVRLREILGAHKELAHKLAELERKLQNHLSPGLPPRPITLANLRKGK